MRPYFIEFHISTQDIETTGTIFPASTVTTDKIQISNTMKSDPLCLTLAILVYCDINIHIYAYTEKLEV